MGEQRPEAGGSHPRVGYVLKVYPCLSQTFILNEILAHEAAGFPVDIFALRPPKDGLFHPGVSRVRSPVTYVPRSCGKASTLWRHIDDAGAELPHLWSALREAGDEEASDVEQAIHLAREIRARGIDVLHAHFGTLAATVARLAGGMVDVPYSFTAHAKDIFHSSVRPHDLRRKLEDAAAVVTVSEFNVDYLHAEYGEAAERVELVYNGLDLTEFELRVCQREPLVLAVGRLVEKKGFGDLVAACAQLKRSGRAIRCEIVGAGPLHDDLSGQIAALDVGDCVRLVGPLTQDEVRSRIRRARVLVAPCIVAADGDREGLPTILLEAMALGTPCVSTDVTGIPEVLEHEVTGLAVPQRDPGAIADACHRLLCDETLRARLAHRARERIESDFDIRRSTAGLRRVFSDIAEPAREAAVA